LEKFQKSQTFNYLKEKHAARLIVEVSDQFLAPEVLSFLWYLIVQIKFFQQEEICLKSGNGRGFDNAPEFQKILLFKSFFGWLLNLMGTCEKYGVTL